MYLDAESRKNVHVFERHGFVATSKIRQLETNLWTGKELFPKIMETEIKAVVWILPQ